MNLSANAVGSNGAAAGANTAGNAGNDGFLYSEPLEIVTIPSPFVATGGNGSSGGTDAGNLGGSNGGTGGDGVSFSGQNGTALTAGNFTGLVNDSVITGGNGGNGSASGAATSGHVSGGTGGYGGNGITASASYSEISGTGTVTAGTGGNGGTGGTSGDTGGAGGFGGDGIEIDSNNTEFNSMGTVVGGAGGGGGLGNRASSGNGGHAGIGILVAGSSALLTVNNNVTGGNGGNGGASEGGGQAGSGGNGGYGIDIDALGVDANLTIGAAATILGGSIGVNGATGSGIAAAGGELNGVGVGVEGIGGTITNNGTVEGGSAGVGVAVSIAASTTLLTNTGHIIATTSDGVRAEDFFNYGAVTLTTLDNANGTISATTGDAVEVAGDIAGSHIGTLANTGAISATSGNAIMIDNAGNGGATIGTLTNTGTISATTGVALDIINGGILTTLNNTGGTITSANVVGAGAPDNATVVLDSTSQTALTLNGTISNTAANNAAEALSIQATPSGTITTAGTIQANGAGGANSGAGVAIEFDATAAVDNTGAIYGQIINTGNHADTLTNSGTIQGAVVLGSAGTFNNAGAITLSGGASTVGALNNSATGNITIDSGKTLTTTEASGGGTYTFQLTPGSTTLNGAEGQLISGTTNLTGATIQVAPAAGSFVNDSLFEIVAGIDAVTGVTATPTDVGAAHGDTATYKFYDVLGGTALSSAFGGGIVPGNADDVFIIAVNQGTSPTPTPTPTPSPTTTIYNSDNFNLTDWDLTLPINSSGGTTGTAETVSSLTNYTSPYFYANADGSMTFNAPVVGATTNSTFGAGSGLNEQGSAGWNLATGGTMSATLEVNSVPTLTTGGEGSVIIGQIMVQNSNIALAQLYYDAGKIYFKNTLYSGEQDTYQLTDAAGNTPTIGLNQKFSYMIEAHGSTLTVEVIINGDTYTSTTPIDPSWQSLSLYFKAGVFDGDAGTSGASLPQATGAGQATFYGFDMSHTAGDGLGGLTAPVTSTDLPPVTVTDNVTGTENQPITGNMLTNDTDPNGLALSVTPATLTTAHGSVVENANGTFTYTPTTGYTGSDTFNYVVQDSAGLTANGEVNITVNATATSSPPVTHTETYNGTENQPITGNMLTNDTDPNGLALSVTAATLTTAHGSVVENANGTFTYTPTSGYTGADTFNYTVKDTAGLSSIGTVDVTVTAPSSTAPVAETADFTSSENDPMFGNVLVNNGNGPDTDPNGSWLSTAAATLTTAHGATVTEASDGTITYIPAANFTGTDTFTYTLQDGAGYTSTGTVDVTVEPLSNTVTFGPGSNMLFGASGSDTFVFAAANLGTGVDTIRNFSLAENDKIDISNVLSGHYNPATEVLSNFVNIATSGSNSIVEVDLTGHAGASGWSQVATLFSVTGLNEQSLVTNGNLIV